MKHKPNWFLRVVLVFFIAFMVMYISTVTGYQEKKLHDKVIFTEDKINEFENDLLAGKEVDIKNYLNNEYIDYSNFLTRTGDVFTETVESFITNGLTGVWNTLKVLFW